MTFYEWLEAQPRDAEGMIRLDFNEVWNAALLAERDRCCAAVANLGIQLYNDREQVNQVTCLEICGQAVEAIREGKP